MSSIKYFVKGTVKGSRCAESYTLDMDAYELVEYVDEIKAMFPHRHEPDNLAKYIWDEEIIYGVITEIWPGVKVIDRKLYSWTEITATRELTDGEKKALLNYLAGQFSDGYGEGLEQQRFTSYIDTETEEEYDEEEDEYYEQEYDIEVDCYLHLWNSSEFELEFVEADEIKEEIVEPTKPRCKLIGQDGNIFNLVGIASRTLKSADLADKAKEMQNRVFSSGSYSEALAIISEYVEVV